MPDRGLRRVAVIIPLMCLFGAQALASGDAERPSGEERSIQVYLHPQEALAKLFPHAEAFIREAHFISEELRTRTQKCLGQRFADDSLAVYIAASADHSLLGYAVMGEEIGKYRPITYAVAMTPGFRVTGAAILVYRESRGSEVRRSRFLRQYVGKDLSDPIRINRDIVNISGATLSVRALNFGVRKTLALTEQIYTARDRAAAP
ncbi:MAG: FMN-binding protein [Candidatus Latescibacterota bacterium]|nr:FMN-binding protein [Candidatus Latescibacterota bacterium]